MIGPVLGVALMLVGLAAVGTCVFAAVARPRTRSWSWIVLAAGAAVIVSGLWLVAQTW